MASLAYFKPLSRRIRTLRVTDDFTLQEEGTLFLTSTRALGNFGVLSHPLDSLLCAFFANAYDVDAVTCRIRQIASNGLTGF